MSGQTYIGAAGGGDKVNLEDQILIAETGVENPTRRPFDDPRSWSSVMFCRCAFLGPVRIPGGALVEDLASFLLGAGMELDHRRIEVGGGGRLVLEVAEGVLAAHE